jgi:hypothetical protein
MHRATRIAKAQKQVWYSQFYYWKMYDYEKKGKISD